MGRRSLAAVSHRGSRCIPPKQLGESMTTPTPQRGKSFMPVSIGLGAVYLIAILALVGAVLAASGDGKGGSTAGGTSTVKVSLSEFKISGNLTAPAGKVVLDVSNDASMDHNLAFEGTKAITKTLSKGATELLDLGELAPGEYELTCTIPGHADSGMKATLTITEAGASGGDAPADGMAAHGGGDTPDYAKMDEDMLATFAAFPAKTEGVGGELAVPKILEDGTKEFDLTAKIAKWEVEPGKVVDAWTYNGTVPGPTIKVDIGDKIRVNFQNELPLNSDIHWHGIETPFGMDGVSPITQDPVKPGGDFTYEFTLDRAYQGMYHPHLHGDMTVPNGMWGVIQAGPTPIVQGRTIGGRVVPPDVKPVLDIPMVLNDAGAIGLSLNGKSFPATAPIVVNEGDWVSMTYYNEGLLAHPMHLHQFPQLVTARDGFPLDSPFWVDTLNVAPGERYTVMFQATKKGTWVFHCHILNHAERETGMFGMVTAVVVQ